MIELPHTSLWTAICVGSAIRLSMLFVGILLDNFSTQWHYTDIDYSIYSDAAQLVWVGQSPYERPTYRYPPIFAWIMMVNTEQCPSLGKIWLVLFDILIICEIWNVRSVEASNSIAAESLVERRWWALVWALNPISSYIATRGSLDSISNYLIVFALRLVLQGCSRKCQSSSLRSIIMKHRLHTMIAGTVYGLAVYCRVYPIIYLPAFLTFLYTKDKDWSFFLHSFATSLLFLFLVSYHLYGSEYLEQSILYHVVRTDHRHNFSIYFYHFYLTYNRVSDVHVAWSRSLLSILSSLLQLLGIFLPIWRFASSDLAFCLFIQTICFVAFNKVITGQYFLWFLVFVPLCWDRKGLMNLLSMRQTKYLLAIWSLSLMLWLFFAFKLEMKGENTFSQIWMMSLVFLLTNCLMMSFLVSSRSLSVER